MPTTANGVPYPSSSDPVAEGAAAIQALAEYLDGSDAGWRNWTTGVTTGYTVQIRQIGSTVWVSVSGNPTVPTGQTRIATGLPSAPAYAWQGCRLGNQPGLIVVATNGTLYVYNPTGATQSSINALYLYPVTDTAAVLAQLEAAAERIEDYRDQPHPDPLEEP